MTSLSGGVQLKSNGPRSFCSLTRPIVARSGNPHFNISRKLIEIRGNAQREFCLGIRHPLANFSQGDRKLETFQGASMLVFCLKRTESKGKAFY
jgi:hypothetical protein